MKIVVISTPCDAGDFFAARLLPTTPRVARGADRVYRFYRSELDDDYAFTDLAGQPLIEVHTFETMPQADAWVTADARQRQTLLSAGGRTQ